MALLKGGLNELEFDDLTLDGLLVIQNQAEQAPKILYQLLPLLKLLQVLIRGISSADSNEHPFVLALLGELHHSIGQSKSISLNLAHLKGAQRLFPPITEGFKTRILSLIKAV